MKKFVLFFLVVCLCASFSACGLIGDIIGGNEPENEMNSANKGILGGLAGLGKDNKDEKYGELIEMLENEDYESAIMYIVELAQENTSLNTEDVIIATLPIGGPSSTEAPEEVVSDAVVWTYNNIVRELEYYAESGYFSFYDEVNGQGYDGEEAFARAYEFLSEYSDYEAAKEYLARFSVVEGVLLRKDRVSYDHLDNSNEYEGFESFEYDADGNLSWAYYSATDMRYGNWYDEFSYEYDVDGNVVKTKIGWNDTDMLIVPTYENGVLVSEEVRCADGDVFTVMYGYDEAGNLSYWVTERDNYLYSNTYTYNEMGLLAGELILASYYDSWYGEYVIDDTTTKTYSYDGNGNLVQMVEFVQEDYNSSSAYYWREHTDIHNYTCDELGRVVSEDITYGDYTYGYDGSVSVQDEVRCEIGYVWGNYFFFE
ncbi:MAG: hypothetical protein IKM29_00280 [Clostridia bacterium]|nr:hypothetical protein [Clostridia bacterium]